jgi:hypothetical protein
MITEDNIYIMEKDNIHLSTTTYTTQIPTINNTYLSPINTTTHPCSAFHSITNLNLESNISNTVRNKYTCFFVNNNNKKRTIQKVQQIFSPI